MSSCASPLTCDVGKASRAVLVGVTLLPVLSEGLNLRPVTVNHPKSRHSSRTAANQMPILIHSFARSGSSTVMSMVSDTEFLEHPGKDCWSYCEKKEGYCDWCGYGNGCCKQGVSDNTPGCIGVKEYYTGGAIHECVATPDSLYERSILAEGKPSRVFSMFEPCDKEDKLKPPLDSMGCRALLQKLAQCDFAEIEHLRGWRDVHSNTMGLTAYDPLKASSVCKTAEIMAFKTVSKPGERFNQKGGDLSLLKDDKRMHMVHIIRDPRAVYASWYSTWPFSQNYQRDPSKLTEICDDYAASLALKHRRVHQLVFEKMIVAPKLEMEQLYSSLGLRFGDPQLNWLNRTFNAKDCPGVDQWIAPYSDCHTESKASLDKWRQILTDNEKELFSHHGSCKKIAKVYGYALE